MKAKELENRAYEVALKRANFNLYHSKIELSDFSRDFSFVKSDTSLDIRAEFKDGGFHTAKVLKANGRKDWEIVKIPDIDFPRRSRAARLYLNEQGVNNVESVDSRGAQGFTPALHVHSRHLVQLEFQIEDQVFQVSYALRTNYKKLDREARAYGNHILRKIGLFERAANFVLKVYGIEEN